MRKAFNDNNNNHFENFTVVIPNDDLLLDSSNFDSINNELVNDSLSSEDNDDVLSID